MRPGYKQTEVGMIPDSWELKRLGEMLTICHGRNQKEVEDVNGLFPILASGGRIGTASRPLYEKPSVLIGRKGTINQPRYMDTPFWTVDTLFYSAITGNNDAKFLYYKFCLIDWLKYNEASGVPSLNARTIENILIAAPKPNEQAAISQVLSDVDLLLDSLNRLIAKKCDLKLAVMQQLLSGKNRLPGFHKEWETMHVEDVITSAFCGPSPTCEERNIQDSKEWGVLKTTAATKEIGWDWTKHKTLPKVFWNKTKIELKKGDVIVTKAGPRHRVGVAVWVSYVPPQIIPSGKMVALRPDQDKIVPLMLAAAISDPSAQLYLNQRTTGMAESQVNFENTALLETPIRVPQIDEQYAIAAVLSDMDAELVALKSQRDKTRLLKQGMMQELLSGKTQLVKSETPHA